MDVPAALRDPRFILAILGLVVTISLFLIGQWWWRRKALTYTTEVTALLAVHYTLKPKVRILLEDDSPAENIKLVVITIRNTGQEPIKAADFERPIQFDCGDQAQILTLEVEKTNPEKMGPEVRIAKRSCIELAPLLLNRGNWLKIKALVNRMETLSPPDDRISGVQMKRGEVGEFPEGDFIAQLITGVPLVLVVLFFEFRFSQRIFAGWFILVGWLLFQLARFIWWARRMGRL